MAQVTPASFARPEISYDGLMMKAVALISLPVSLLMAGCASMNDAAMALQSSSTSAVAVVHETLLLGTAVIFNDRTGTLNLESDTEPRVKCMGTLRYTSTRTGVAKLTCSDGADALMYFSAIGETRGYGTGTTAKGTASFTFGFELAEASAYLTPPPGKRVVVSSDGRVRLEPL
jgi:hypothetical protein